MTYARREISNRRYPLKTFCLAIFLALSCFMDVEPVMGMDAESLYLRYSAENPDLCGYVDHKGRVVIPFGKYQHCFTEVWSRFAVVYHAKKGLIAIDRKEKVLFKVMSVDNGPDYPSEGLFRIIKDNKIGFANINGEVVIKPKFTAALPFSEGLAAFCEDCILVKQGEHQSWQKGKWGFIDKSGNIVIPAKYDNVIDGFRKGQAKVELNGETVIINSNGKVITPRK